MKNLRSGLLATAIILVSAGSAFATNVAKKDKSSTTEPGFRFDPSAPVEKCINTGVECTTVDGDVCQWSDGVNMHDLQKYINGTACGETLYKP